MIKKSGDAYLVNSILKLGKDREKRIISYRIPINTEAPARACVINYRCEAFALLLRLFGKKLLCNTSFPNREKTIAIV